MNIKDTKKFTRIILHCLLAGHKLKYWRNNYGNGRYCKICNIKTYASKKVLNKFFNISD